MDLVQTSVLRLPPGERLLADPAFRIHLRHRHANLSSASIPQQSAPNARHNLRLRRRSFTGCYADGYPSAWNARRHDLSPCQVCGGSLDETDAHDLWNSGSFIQLNETLLNHREDFAAVESALNWVVEEYWDVILFFKEGRGPHDALRTAALWRQGAALDGCRRNGCLRPVAARRAVAQAASALLCWAAIIEIAHPCYAPVKRKPAPSTIKGACPNRYSRATRLPASSGKSCRAPRRITSQTSLRRPSQQNSNARPAGSKSNHDLPSPWSRRGPWASGRWSVLFARPLACPCFSVGK